MPARPRGAPWSAPGARWSAVALAVFGLALAVQYGAVLREGPREVVPVTRALDEERPDDPAPERIELLLGPGSFRTMQHIVETTDLRFVAWIVSSNAHRWVTRPWALFEGEPCAPVASSVALGHPVFTHGLLAVPAWLATGDPLVAYDFAHAAVTLLGALAMFLVVRRFTASGPAAVVAGLLYGFHGAKVGLPVYPFKPDYAWALLALWSADRFVTEGRVRDALTAGAFCALQLALSFYAFFGALLLAVPFGAWLVLRARRAPPSPAGALGALAIVGVAAGLVFAPYLRMKELDASALVAVRQNYALWSGFVPGRFVGVLVAAFALLGLLLPPRARRSYRGVRWAALAAALLVAAVATGGNVRARLAAELAGTPVPPTLPNLYAALSSVVPGLDSVRSPVYFALAVHPALCVLAGFGIAGVLERVRAPAALAALLGGVVAVDTLFPEIVPGRAQTRYVARTLRPEPELLSLYEGLGERGGDGALLELPMLPRSAGYALLYAGQQVLLSSYHHRRTSGCYNSFIPEETYAVADLAAQLPDPDALRALRAQGFTTVVVWRPSEGAPSRELARLRPAIEAGLLEPLGATTRLEAFAIRE